MNQLKGYQLKETIYEGKKTVVCRGIRERDSRPVIVKFLQGEYPARDELECFESAYRIARDLNLAGIVKPLGLEKVGHSKALVMDDIGSVSLKEYINTHSIDIQTSLEIALSITEILGSIHQQGVIHRDIKPSNILINPKSKDIKIIDFGLATHFSRESYSDLSLEDPQGTLSYISPEQTGRMNRHVDYRSDYYSLGVTLYEMLTGRRPFDFMDPIELVHAHIARQPVPPEVNSDIPQAISDIVMKLLSKMAEERYQSEAGLKADLFYCYEMLKQKGAIEIFELGQKDIPDRFQVPLKLYGRDEEIKLIHDEFARVAKGEARAIIMGGHPGVGKTFLMETAIKSIRRIDQRQKRYYVMGKFDYVNRYIPYSALIQAFQGLIKQILTEPEKELEKKEPPLSMFWGVMPGLLRKLFPNSS